VGNLSAINAKDDGENLPNCLTIDVEPWMCYYDTCALNKKIDGNLTVDLTNQILDILDKHGVKATFFVVGKVYEWYPELVEGIAQSGHEVAFHTSTHKKIYNTRVLARELEGGRKFFKRFKIMGFRAPEMNLPLSALEILARSGLEYDSSTYASSGRPVRINGFLEVPVSTYSFLKKDNGVTLPRTLFDAIKDFEIPFGSGYFIGMLNSHLLNGLLTSFNREDKSAVLFMHPWQLVDVPQLPAKFSEYLMKYRLRISEKKIQSMLTNHYFTTIREMIKYYQNAE
jgi:peptidoglycan/xylan/chitin deacetylase (PgdA/CDA1 family)